MNTWAKSRQSKPCGIVAIEPSGIEPAVLNHTTFSLSSLNLCWSAQNHHRRARGLDFVDLMEDNFISSQ